jgi:gliding motility-associated-like protein
LSCRSPYRYKVEAVNYPDGSLHSFSNESTNKAYDTKAPAPVHLRTASVEDNSRVYLDWMQANTFDAEGYIVYRLDGQGGGLQPVKVIRSKFDITYLDTIGSIDHSYCYYVTVFDSCGNISKAGNYGCTMLLSGKALELQDSLYWNPYTDWGSPVNVYNIYRLDSSAGWINIGTVNGSKVTFTDKELPDDRPNYCYKIQAMPFDLNLNMPSWSTSLCLKQEPVVYIPDAFTPGMSDGLNDYFKPEGMFINSYEMRIFNRWGQMIYSTVSSQPWDGRVEGQFVQEGVYMYQVIITSHTHKVSRYGGTVLILR